MNSNPSSVTKKLGVLGQDPSSCLSFLVCKMGILILSLYEDCCEDEWLNVKCFEQPLAYRKYFATLKKFLS